MIRKDCLAIVVLAVFAFGCTRVPPPHNSLAEVVEVTLPAPEDRVKAAVTKVLEDDNYDVKWTGASELKTGYRGEEPSIYDNWLTKGRFGVVRSYYEGSVTPETGETTRLRLQVSSEGKSTIWQSWVPATTQVPQSAENKLRLIKNELKIVQDTYTTQTFYGSNYGLKP